MSLISSMGVSYFREWFHGALFIYNNRPCQVEDTDGVTVSCRYLDTTTDRAVSIPAQFFTGFKVFEYPPLGYRRVGNVVYHVHRSQSAYRGLRANLLTFELSPIGYLLQSNERTAVGNSTNALNLRLTQVMTPTFDTRASLDDLIAGRRAGVVPSEDVCIEPSVNGEDYVVLYREKQVGTMDSNKNFHIDNPAVAAAVNNAFRE